MFNSLSVNKARPSCAKNDQKSFAGWKTIKPMINCVEKHCLHGGFESVPKPFWKERFYCLQCGTIVSNSQRDSHDKKCRRVESRNEQPSQIDQAVEPGLDFKHNTECYLPTLEEVVEKNSPIASFARALIRCVEK